MAQFRVSQLSHVMRLSRCTYLLALSLCGCASKQAHVVSNHRDRTMNSYFEWYCDYVVGPGIGLPASLYDYEFCQRLKTTRDTELRRLFVCQRLYRELDLVVSDFEQGIVTTGKESGRPMTPDERASMRVFVTERLADLSRFDPEDPHGKIAALRLRLSQLEMED
jgi:hypothetical protein